MRLVGKDEAFGRSRGVSSGAVGVDSERNRATAAGAAPDRDGGLGRGGAEGPGLERSERLMLWLLFVAAVCVAMAVLSPLYVGFGAPRGMGSVFFLPGVLALGEPVRGGAIRGEGGE